MIKITNTKIYDWLFTYPHTSLFLLQGREHHLRHLPSVGSFCHTTETQAHLSNGGSNQSGRSQQPRRGWIIRKSRIYRNVQISLVKGCVSPVLGHATFDGVLWDSRVNSPIFHPQLKTDETKNFFYDRASSIAYRKFTESRRRDSTTDLSDCIGKLRNLDGCPSMRVNLRKVKSELPNINWADGDCTSRL